MAGELAATIATLNAQKRSVDLGLPGQDLTIRLLLDGIATKIDALVAAEQGAGDLSSLTIAMAAFTATIRDQADEICTAAIRVKVFG